MQKISLEKLIFKVVKIFLSLMKWTERSYAGH